MKITIPWIALKKPLKVPKIVYSFIKRELSLNTLIIILFWTIVNIYCGRAYASVMPLWMIFFIVFIQYIVFVILTNLMNLLWNKLDKKKAIEFKGKRTLTRYLETHGKRKIGDYIDTQTLKSPHFKRATGKREDKIEH